MGSKWQEKIFSFIHGHSLIYNTCWEDPRLDHELLQLTPESQVVAITSAGCNVLDYLVEVPATIHAVDVNSRQNALLSLKMAMIEHGDHDSLFTLFGRGGGPSYRKTYTALRPYLPVWARKFWDVKIGYFSPRGWRPSFYWHGGAGIFAWFFQNLLVKRGPLRRPLGELVNARSLEEQRRLYDEVEPHLFRRPITWMLRRPAAMACIGVPTPQLSLIESQYPGGLVAFIRESLRRVFTTVPMKENYFWRVYLTGSYSPDCCPRYLQPENFQTLRQRLTRVTLHNTTVTRFLRENPGNYSHFILMDHQDWLAFHNHDALREEWEEIFRNSRPGARILMRSAGLNVGFLPAAALSRLRFFPHLTQKLHQQDRVGTYGSLHLAEVI
jgi:S-adenosylmethionine-diacylglycerol 3-amino-3-carboxypropyl transferase